MDQHKQTVLAKDIWLNFPLYQVVDLAVMSVEDKQALLDRLRVPPDALDTYCTDCQQPGTFLGNQVALTADRAFRGPESITGQLIVTEFRCARDQNHRIYYTFRLTNDQLIKIGQYPSIADLGEYEIRPYKKVLSDEKYREFARSIGLVTHGVGIGAFVYLRRIFEDLIEEARQKALKANKKEKTPWDDMLYEKSRIEEKILLLKDYLPAFLVDNRLLYTILSKGIHSLSEDECLKYFGTVRMGIEMILDEKLSEKQREEKSERAKKDLNSLHQELKSSE